MNASYDKSDPVVVLPRVTGGRLQDKSLRTWLAQADLQVEPERSELLGRITRELDLPYPQEGLAALRMWGQTGERPTVWIAAADPVHLEPRLDRLCLHEPRRIGLPSPDLRALIDHLQITLADKKQFGFTQLGSCGYLSAKVPISTAAVPAYVVDQQAPGEFLPGGGAAATFRNLLSEIEMSLHEHGVNQRRLAAGQQPVNSLWLWGGGKAPQRQTRPQPPLFADDPLLLGYWDSATAIAKLWPGSVADCIEDAVEGFVAVTPECQDDPAFLHDCLSQLRAAQRANRIGDFTILFRDGIRADLQRSHALRFWRRDSELLN